MLKIFETLINLLAVLAIVLLHLHFFANDYQKNQIGKHLG